MKKFNNLKMVLFDSTKAAFKLSVEAVFTKGNAMGGVQPLAYITDQGNGALNPNIYLTLTYKGETFEQTKSLYTSYPQLFALRRVLEEVKNLVADESGFLRADGIVSVKQGYEKPFVLSGIGKKNKWISFSLGVVESGENGITETFPVVIIEMSDANGAVSTLNIEEFLTVYTIIKDLDLASIQCQMALAYLGTMDDARPNQGYNGGYQQPAYRPQQQYAPRYSNNYNNNYQAQYGQYSQPQRQYTPQYQKPEGMQTRTFETPAGPSQIVTPTKTESVNVAPNGLIQTPSSQMQPRNEKPILNFDNVEATPYSSVDYDDLANLGKDIFGDEE